METQTEPPDGVRRALLAELARAALGRTADTEDSVREGVWASSGTNSERQVEV